MDQLVVVPLQAAPDDVAWAATLDRVRSTWTGLRVALAQAGVGVAAAGAGEPLPLPFVALQEPAHGAAAHAVELLRWLGEQGASAARGQQASRDAEVLRQVVDDVAVIELCWLTLVGPRPPAACVADAAAWEAYSRARSAEPGLRSLGFDPSGMPRESADEAAARGLALLDAVAAGWTDEDRRAVERARVREPLAP
ncbi:MAG: hypothetical protein H6732_20455 [Alphaproteobacteria bacterium]|nr:hypothetical protein [Alphaproteobacteria bacterium]